MVYDEISANKRKTVLIFVFFFLIAGGLAWLFGKILHSFVATEGIFIGGLVYAFFSYLWATKLCLAINGAKEIAKKNNPRLWRIVENISITDGLPMPKVYIMADPAPNAFATGRDPNHAAVCATDGLLEILNDSELEGVIAHELGHIKNYDIRVSLVAFALVAVIGLIADILLRMTWFSDDDDNNSQVFLIVGIVAAIIAPFAAMLIQLAISRKREYLADATGALTTRYPEGLASALEKLKLNGRPLKRQNSSTAHLFITNPMKGKVSSLFSTHPPLDDRIKVLRKMEANA